MTTPDDASEESFEAWLDRVIIAYGENDLAQLETYKPGSDAREPATTYPANFIRRAIVRKRDGDEAILSGIEARRMRFVGDLHLENLEINFPLFLLGCTFDGAIYGGGSRTRTLSFTNSLLRKGADLRNARVEGHLFLRGVFESYGPLLLRDMRIEGTLDLRGGRFLYSRDSAGHDSHAFDAAVDGECLSLSRAEAAAMLWRPDPPADMGLHPPELTDRTPRGTVNLRDLKVRAFAHDLERWGLAGWPGKGRLVLEGFVYERIDDAPLTTFLCWLALQRRISPAPYFQLASVLEKQGRKEDANGVRAQVRRNEVAGYSPVKKFFAKLVFWPVKYGASPIRALGLMLALLGLYWASVAGLAVSGRMEPAASGTLFNSCYYGHPTCQEDLKLWHRIARTKSTSDDRYVPPDYPELSAFQYSLEAFVPFFDFGEHDHWQPTDGWLGLLLALVALIGIFLGSLFFAAVAGLMRPRES